MSFPKILALIAIVLITIIGIAAALKKSKTPRAPKAIVKTAGPIEIDLSKDLQPAKTPAKLIVKAEEVKAIAPAERPLPHADRIAELFNTRGPKLSIVETITYRSRVPWQKGRPAWLSDYATYYTTSRHFIARSLNGKPDYFKQDVAEGDRFNVLKKDKKINFHLVIDASRCRMWFYSIDLDTNERLLLKDYIVGLGRKDTAKASGLLTPLGKYSLGNKIAIYKPKMMGIYNGQKVEMIRVFGSRWIPFDQEINQTTAPSRGLGIHGLPWKVNDKGELVEELSSLGKYQSDGCIRLATNDMEEIFAIIITKPTIVELVKDFYDAQLPGIEK